MFRAKIVLRIIDHKLGLLKGMIRHDMGNDRNHYEGMEMAVIGTIFVLL